MIGMVLIGRYLIEEKVGSGGMSEVYRALDLNTDRQVAVKILREEFAKDEDFVRRFHREAQAAAALTHEYLVGVYDMGEQDGTQFIVLEYVRGVTLKDVIRQQGALPLPVVIRIAQQLCSALEHAHHEHIIHRDIKPQNILVDNNGRSKLTDFGIARATTSSTVTMTDGSVMGSVHYFSPEQARGELAEEQSDIYSLGVVLYEMATGKLPFEGETPVSVALAHLQEPAKNPGLINPNLPPALCEIIEKAMAKDKCDRYQSARELQADIDRVMQEPQGGYVVRRALCEDDPTRLVPIVQLPEDEDAAPEGEVITPASEVPVVRKASRRGSFVALGLLSVAFVALLWVVISLTNVFAGVDRELVPAVVNLTEEKALEALREHNLRASIEREYNDSVKPGVVIRQSPTDNTQLAPSDMVQLWVSNGPMEITTPHLVGKDEQTAREMLDNMGLKPGQIFRQESSEPRGTVFAQDPQAGILIGNGEPVDLYISEPPLTRKTPDVRKLTVEKAFEQIRLAGLAPGEVIEEEVSDIEPGIVFRQSPQESKDALDGSRVDLWVSKEPQPGYRKTQVVEVVVPEGGGQVNIYLENDKGEQTLSYEARYEAGLRTIELNLESEQEGKAKLIIQVNGKQVKTMNVNFTQKDREN